MADTEVPKPKGGVSPVQGRGTRQPSRRAFPGGVLEEFFRDVFYLVEAQFLALVDVGPAGQGEHEEGGRSGAAGAEGEVAGNRPVPEQGLHAGVGAAVAGDVTRRAGQRRGTSSLNRGSVADVMAG
ncbi:hypothetical protein [Streptomyces sp. ME19-01-6]|uniref:hypothetical protein n=1 Tax=Streptomyces sp. ME19-01-6 TaxID=3028686 RepID=UPI0039F4B780